MVQSFYIYILHNLTYFSSATKFRRKSYRTCAVKMSVAVVYFSQEITLCHSHLKYLEAVWSGEDAVQPFELIVRELMIFCSPCSWWRHQHAAVFPGSVERLVSASLRVSLSVCVILGLQVTSFWDLVVSLEMLDHPENSMGIVSFRFLSPECWWSLDAAVFTSLIL